MGVHRTLGKAIQERIMMDNFDKLSPKGEGYFPTLGRRYKKTCLKCKKEFIAYSSKAQRCPPCSHKHYIEYHRNRRKIERKVLRDITCLDCGCVFQETGRKRYCPNCFAERRTAAAKKMVETRKVDKKIPLVPLSGALHLVGIRACVLCAGPEEDCLTCKTADFCDKCKI